MPKTDTKYQIQDTLNPIHCLVRLFHTIQKRGWQGPSEIQCGRALLCVTVRDFRENEATPRLWM